jgi:methylmalonyl-CoA mutase N-terminal domain/subunit
VNKYVDPPKPEQIEIHKIDPATEARQVARTAERRRRRDGGTVSALLDRLEREAGDPAINLMPVTIELVKARATMGEIVARLKKVFGTYVESAIF